MSLRDNLTIAVLWITMLLGITCVHLIPNVKEVPARKSFIYFPFKIGDWVDKEIKASELAITSVMPDDLMIREYVNRDGEKIELFMAYFNYVKENKGPHTPLLCWVGMGWTFKDLGSERIVFGKRQEDQVEVKKLLAQDRGKSVLLFYCYRINKKYISNFFDFRITALIDTVIKRRNNAFTLQLSSYIKQDEIKSREKKMNEFLTKVFPILESEFLP